MASLCDFVSADGTVSNLQVLQATEAANDGELSNDAVLILQQAANNGTVVDQCVSGGSDGGTSGGSDGGTSGGSDGGTSGGSDDGTSGGSDDSQDTQQDQYIIGWDVPNTVTVGQPVGYAASASCQLNSCADAAVVVSIATPGGEFYTISEGRSYGGGGETVTVQGASQDPPSELYSRSNGQLVVNEPGDYTLLVEVSDYFGGTLIKSDSNSFTVEPAAGSTLDVRGPLLSNPRPGVVAVEYDVVNVPSSAGGSTESVVVDTQVNGNTVDTVETTVASGKTETVSNEYNVDLTETTELEVCLTPQ